MFFKSRSNLPELTILKQKIAESTEKEAQLRETLEHLSKHYEHAPISYQSLDKKGCFIEVNHAWLDKTGYAKEEVLGKNFREFLHQDYQEFYKENFCKFIAIGEIFGVEFKMIKKDGSPILVSFDGTISKDQEGNFQHTHCIFRDITEHRRVAKELKKLQERSSQAKKMESVGRLAGGVAHEFNNMLNVIIGYTELALGETEPSSTLHHHLLQVIKAAQRSAKFTKKLVGFTSHQHSNPKILNLNVTIEQEMLQMLRKLIGENIDLCWQPKSNLWMVKIDPSQVNQLLVNLCINARDAITGKGKITISTDKVILDAAYCASHPEARTGGYVLLTVKDNGCGISREILDNIFEPFFTTKKFGQSSGFGLASVYGIVKQNKGFVNVSSDLGQGTTFEIYLPRYLVKAE